MPLPPIPIDRYLVPPAAPEVPAGFNVVDQKVLGGLPHAIDLGGGRSLVLILPTGLAAAWRDADPSAVISRSDDELVPAPASDEPGGGPDDPAASARRAADVGRPAPRLVLRDGRRPVGSMPLAAGARRLLPDGGAAAAGTTPAATDAPRGVFVEVRVIGWDLRAGSLVGPGDFGSWVRLAWRPVDRAVERYSTPPVQPQVVRRIPDVQPVESVEPTVSRRVRDRLEIRPASQVHVEFALPAVVGPGDPFVLPGSAGARRGRLVQ